MGNGEWHLVGEELERSFKMSKLDNEEDFMRFARKCVKWELIRHFVMQVVKMEIPLLSATQNLNLWNRTLLSSFLLGIYLSFFNKIRYDKHKKSKKGWIFMKLVSWNVNGLRACITKGFYDSFKEIDADIVYRKQKCSRDRQKSF